MATSVQVESPAFSCVKVDEFAVLKLKKRALEMAVDKDLRDDYLKLISTIESSRRFKGLIQINASDFSGDELIPAALGAGDPNEDRNEIGLRLSRIQQAIAHITLAAAKFSKPMIAGLRGKVTAEYLGCTLPFDFRIAAANSELHFPHVEFGLPPSGALAFYLPRYVGQGKAADLLLNRAKLLPQEACDLGLVNEIVDEEALEERCLELLQRVAALPSIGVATTRRLLQPGLAELELFLERSIFSIWSALEELDD